MSQSSSRPARSSSFFAAADRLTRTALALLVVMVGAAGLIVLTLRLQDSQNLGRSLAKANESQAAAISHDRHVLSELCTTNAVLGGLVHQTIILFEGDIKAHVIPKGAVPFYRKTLDTYKGYQSVLDNLTACEKVPRP